MNEWEKNELRRKVRLGTIQTANTVANIISQVVELPDGWAIVEGCESWLMRHPNGYTTLFWDSEYADFNLRIKTGIHDEFLSTIKCCKKRIQAKEELEFIDDRLKML